MKPSTVILSLPVTDLERTLRFYREGLGLETPGIDEWMIALELPNLSLFLIDQQEFAKYANRAVPGAAGAPVPGACSFSCAIGSKEDVDETITKAVQAGGTVQGPARDYDGSYMGYISDPDGHVWELVWNAQTESAAQ